MMNYIIIGFRFIKNNIGKFFIALSFFICFLFLLFPFSDLNDLISAKVYELSHKSIYLQFDKLNINPLTTSVSVNNLIVEAPNLPSLSSSEVTFSPLLNFSTLINQKPGGHIQAKGFLKGDVSLTLTPIGHSESTPSGKNDAKTNPIDKYKIEAQGQNLSLKELKDLLNLSLPFKGQLQFSIQANTDTNFQEQPDGEVSLTISKFELPPSSLSLQDLGRVNLPEIKLGLVELKGKLSNGKFVIESGKLGTVKDEFFGDIKGDLGITLQMMNGQVVPLLGAYNISLDLKASHVFKEKAKFFLTFLDGYKQDLPDGSQYKFKIQAAAMGMAPQITRLQ